MYKARLLTMLLAAAVLLNACGIGVGIEGQNGTGTNVAQRSEAEIRATVQAEFQATAAAQSAASAPAVPSAAAQLSEADIRATVQAEFAATATAGAAQRSPSASAAAVEGGATETVPTPTTGPTAQPTVQAVAQVEAPPALLLLLDSSGSMLLDAGDGRDKITAAKEALKTLVDALPTGAPVGLRVYGHRFPNTDKANGCQDSELVQPVGPLDKNAMKGRIDSFGAQGYTPISLSLEQGYGDLPAEGARTMVLVSDGEETCDRDPCQVARDLEARGVELVIEAVGFQVDDTTRAQLTCIAEATGGQYRDAANAAELADELKEISNRALREYQTAGNQIQAGTGFNDAPLVQPGQYLSDIVAGETHYYAIEVPEGKALSASATFVANPDISQESIPKGCCTEARLKMYGSNRGEALQATFFGEYANSGFGTGKTVTLRSIATGTATLEPGRMFVALTFTDQPNNYGGAEFQVEWVLEVVDE